jgi:DNA-binding response OmpR family regulator
MTLGEGHNVVEARDGLEAARLVETRRPDLAVLDVRLPFFNGLAVCERIKADPETRGARVLMITRGDNRIDRDRALAVGADGFLAKPFSPAEFREKAEELLAGTALAGWRQAQVVPQQPDTRKEEVGWKPSTEPADSARSRYRPGRSGWWATWDGRKTRGASSCLPTGAGVGASARETSSSRELLKRSASARS